MGFQEIGLQGDRRLEGMDGLVGPARHRVCQAQVVACLGELCVEFEGVRVTADCFIRLRCAEEEIAEFEEGIVVFGKSADDFFQFFQGPVMFAASFVFMRDRKTRPDIAGVVLGGADEV